MFYQESTFCTLWFPRYSPGKISKVKVTTARSNKGHTITLDTYKVSPSYTLQFMRYSPGKIFKLKVTMTMSRSNQAHTMMVHTYTPNVPTMYQLPTCYGCQAIYPGKDFKVHGHLDKVKGIAVQDIAHLHPQPMYQPNVNLLHPTDSKIA